MRAAVGGLCRHVVRVTKRALGRKGFDDNSAPDLDQKEWLAQGEIRSRADPRHGQWRVFRGSNRELQASGRAGLLAFLCAKGTADATRYYKPVQSDLGGRRWRRGEGSASERGGGREDTGGKSAGWTVPIAGVCRRSGTRLTDRQPYLPLAALDLLHKFRPARTKPPHPASKLDELLPTAQSEPW